MNSAISKNFYDISNTSKDWKEIRLKYIMSISDKKSSDFNNEKNLSLTKFGIVINDIENNKGQIAESYEKYISIKKNQICMNPMDLVSGWVDISPYDGIISPAYYTFILSGRFNNKFINYYLQSNYFRKTFFTLGKGVASHDNYGRWVLTPEEFKNIFIYYPPFSKQQQIASFLDTKSLLISTLIEKTQQKMELLKEKRLKLIEDIILNSNTKRIQLRNVVNLIKRPIQREDNNTYTKIGMYNWGKGIFKYPSEKGSELGDSSFNYINEGDLLLSGQFAWEGSVSIVEKEEDNCISSHRFHILNCEKTKILKEYLWSYFTSQEGHFLLSENSPGSAGRNRPLNIDKLLKEKIPVPLMNKQMEIQSLVIENRKYEKYSKRKIELLKEYKQSLISSLVIGKIRVSKNTI